MHPYRKYQINGNEWKKPKAKKLSVKHLDLEFTKHLFIKTNT